MAEPLAKPLVWLGSTRHDVRDMPDEVRSLFGYALFMAQLGGKHSDAKPLRGFGGAGVLEVVKDHRGDAFRTVYTVRLAKAVYVLHAFQKKSKAGVATPKSEIETVKRRLREAEQLERGGRQ